MRRACCASTFFVVDLARVLEGLLDRLLGDLVEDHAAELLLRLRAAQRLGEVPADGLALAVGVGGQVDRVGVLGRRLQLVEDLLARGEDLVLGGEALLRRRRPSFFLGRSRTWPMEAFT